MTLEHNRYYKYAELTSVLHDLARRFPKRTRLSSIGKTEQGREIWLMTVTDFEDHDPADRPAVWVDGNTHATELAGCQACVHLIDILTASAEGSRISELLRRTTYYIVPRISADGAEYVLNEGIRVRSTPLDYPGDLPAEDFRVEDLDGDGEALLMRVPDAAGMFKISAQDPRLMVVREADDFSEEQGPYFSLLPEGRFNNYDGFTRRYAHRPRFDLNRQSPADFTPKEYGAGPVPMFLAEARALAQAVIERPNICICVTYHTYGGFLLRPSSLKPDSELPTADLEVYKVMGRIGEKITEYPAISVFHDFKYDPKAVTTGAWDDWHYHHRGVFAWTPEIWSLTRQAGVKLEKPLQAYQDIGPENLLKVIQWCDQNLPAGSFFKEWKTFDHPQLGRVEIGGWRTLYTWSNPPAKFLPAEVDKLSEFALRLSQMAAEVRVKEARVDKIGADIFGLSFVVANAGFLPTSVSESAQSLKVYKTPTATLRLSDGQKLVQGKPEQFIKHLTGRSEGLPWTSSVHDGRIENHHEDLLQYTVQGRGKVEFEARYHGGGVVRRTLHLE